MICFKHFHIFSFLFCSDCNVSYGFCFLAQGHILNPLVMHTHHHEKIKMIWIETSLDLVWRKWHRNLHLCLYLHCEASFWVPDNKIWKQVRRWGKFISSRKAVCSELATQMDFLVNKIQVYKSCQPPVMELQPHKWLWKLSCFPHLAVHTRQAWLCYGRWIVFFLALDMHWVDV